MRTLIFDTETTGIVNYKCKENLDLQPSIVQFGALLVEDDKIYSKISLIINPEVPIPLSASNVHGITNEIAIKYGVPAIDLTHLFCDLLKCTDRVVAHNLEFDLFIMRVACWRDELQIDETFKSACTMKSSTEIINLPPTEKMIAAGFDKPKVPKSKRRINSFSESLSRVHTMRLRMLRQPTGCCANWKNAVLI